MKIHSIWHDIGQHIFYEHHRASRTLLVRWLWQGHTFYAFRREWLDKAIDPQVKPLFPTGLPDA